MIPPFRLVRPRSAAEAAALQGEAPTRIAFMAGGIDLVSVPFGEGASREHYTLCRCGGSKNKPFCDGTHWHIGFKDP